MRTNLLNQSQPFGNVKDERPMDGMGRPKAMDSKPLGGETMRGNAGLDHGPSFADKNPGAHAYACRNVNNPFAWTGHPKKESGK